MNTVNTSARKPFGNNECFDKCPVAMAYVPWQRLTNIYEDLDEALMNGTIFPELNKPFSGRRCCK